MKKLLGIIVLSLLLSGNAYAEEIKELKDLTDNDDFDFAKGGIIGLRL